MPSGKGGRTRGPGLLVNNLANEESSNRSRQEWLERALLAQRLARATEMFADHDQLRMKVLPVIEPLEARLLVE